MRWTATRATRDLTEPIVAWTGDAPSAEQIAARTRTGARALRVIDLGGPLLDLPPGVDGRVAREAARIRTQRRTDALAKTTAGALDATLALAGIDHG